MLVLDENVSEFMCVMDRKLTKHRGRAEACKVSADFEKSF